MSFLGIGWAFPPTFYKSGKNVVMASDEEDIVQSLQILLSTRLGERIMLPKYGCNLEDLLFENLDITVRTYIADLIQTAILYYEPRIEAEKVEFTVGVPGEGRLDIIVRYRVKTTNSRYNFVYPYYQNEGSNLR